MAKATGETMASWLRALPQAELAALLERRVDLLHRPAATLEDMAARLSQPHAVVRALPLVDRTAVQVGAVLSLLDGRATVAQLVDALARTEPVEPGEVEQALQDLAAAALAWPVPGGVWRSATGLRAVAGQLHGALRPPPPEPTDPAAPPVAAAERATALVHDVRALLVACGARPVKALRSGGVGVQELRRLAKGLDKQEDYVAWLLDLAGTAGLLSTGPTAGALTRDADPWRALDEPVAWLALVRPVLDSPAGPRSQLGEQAQPLAAWRYPVDGGFPLRTVLRGATRHAAREDDAALIAWLDWRHYRPLPEPTRRLVLSERLHQLMLLGLRADSTCPPWAAAVRDGDDAAAVAALEHALPPAQDDAVFQADGTAFVGGRASAGLRALLDAVADREGERTWRMAPSRVREQLDAGRTAAELVSELRARSTHALPQVVEQVVLDVAAKHGRIRVFVASTLLRVDDVPLGVEVLRDPRLKALSLVEVQPGVLSSPKPAKEVLAALRAAGHAPVGDEGSRGAAGPPRKAAARRPPAPTRRTPSAADLAARLQAVPVRNPTASRAAPPSPTAAVVSLDRYRLEQRLSHLTDLEIDLLAQAVDRGSRVEIDYVDTGGTPSTRVITEILDEGRLLSAWCEMRNAERHFDPAGIQAVRPG